MTGGARAMLPGVLAAANQGPIIAFSFVVLVLGYLAVMLAWYLMVFKPSRQERAEAAERAARESAEG